jgi:hypothetical protein
MKSPVNVSPGAIGFKYYTDEKKWKKLTVK